MSKYVHAVWDHPPLSSGADVFQEAMDALCAKDLTIELVIPVAESFVRAFAESRLKPPGAIKLASMASDTITFCLNKPLLLSKAAELDIPIAPFVVTSNHQDLLRQASKLNFPLVIRPMDSTKRLGGKKALTCRTVGDLKEQQEVLKDKSLLTQEYVSGKRDNIYFSAHHGELQSYLHAKIERTDQPDGSGLALEGVTVEPCPILKSYVVKLLRGIGYHGIGCVQFLVDEREDRRYLLELNPRLAGNHALAEHAGLTLSEDILDLAHGRLANRPLSVGQAGIRYTWLAGELESLRLAWRAGDFGALQFLRAVGKAIRAYRQADFDVSINRDDWKPGLYSLCDSLPLIGTISRARLENGFVQKILVRKIRLQA
ncbi:hypothetical protein J7444_19885 [Labrenzia sp. R4_1]|uniref:ATP-binding protein n=1 Tax=Stappiaceae TaxID=2821832 RepID=UPI001ADB8A90|nr:hypothetical protein [Labrenzia sp. R4_1]